MDEQVGFLLSYWRPPSARAHVSDAPRRILGKQNGPTQVCLRASAPCLFLCRPESGEGCPEKPFVCGTLSWAWGTVDQGWGGILSCLLRLPPSYRGTRLLASLYKTA